MTPLSVPRWTGTMRMTAKVLLGLTLSSAWTATGAGQQSKGPMREETLRELMRVVNTRDTAAIHRFVDERFVTSGPDARPAAARRYARS